MKKQKRKIIIVLSGLLIVTVAVICGFSYFSMELISDKVSVEAGSPLSQKVSDYAKGNITDAKLDLSDVNVKRTGVYNASLSNKTRTLTFDVEVVDTVSPTAEKVNGLSFATYKEVKASELVIDVKDIGRVMATYKDGKESHIYTEGGETRETVLLTDESGNQTEIDVVFQVIADVTKPAIKGLKAITFYAGDEVEYRKGIKASDDRDGDLTKDIRINTDDVNPNKPGKYTALYSVSDSSGNEVIKKVRVTVLEDNKPVLKGLTDKTVYINDKIDYLKGITASDDKDGNLSAKIKVDSSKVNLKAAGVYKVTYSVTDSAGHKTVKSISITVKKKESTSPKQSKSSSAKVNKKTNQEKGSNTSGGFEFFDVPPSGPDVDGDVPASGEHVGTWG